MRRGGEATHVGADLGQDHLRGDRPDPGDRIQPGHRTGQLAELALDAGLHGGDVGGDAVDPVEHLGQQERVVLGEPTGQRLSQAGGLRAQPAEGQLGQHRGIALNGDQRGHDRPPGGAERVADDHRELDQRVLEQLVQAEWTAHLGVRRMTQLRRILTDLREITDPWR